MRHLPIGLLVFAAWSCSFSSNHPKEQKHLIQALPGVAAKGEIAVEAVIDSEGIIHLVWQEQERGIQYCRSSDHGKTWSAAVEIAAQADFSRAARPRLFSHNDSFMVIWLDHGFNLKTSFDRGKTWTTEAAKIIESSPIATHEMCQNERSIFLAYTNHQGLFTRRSDDRGQHWTEPENVISIPIGQVTLSKPALVARKGVVYLLWSQAEEQFSAYRLFTAQSRDYGESWSVPMAIDLDRQRYGTVYKKTYAILSPAMVATHDHLYVFYEERGLFCHVAGLHDLSWSKATRVSPEPARNFSAFANENAVVVAWSDARYQEQDWWGYLPGHQIITWDKDPRWANNDLFVSTIVKTPEAMTSLVTPALSYVNGNGSAISVHIMADQRFIFWSGRKKVGKSVQQYGFPVEIFYVISTDEILRRGESR